MMRFEWNALRVGDSVRIHRNGTTLEPGTVAFVDVLRGSNGIGVRTAAANGEGRVTWPSREAVHAATDGTEDPDAPCLRCAALRLEEPRSDTSPSTR
jgi:hypothetical protein